MKKYFHPFIILIFVHIFNITYSQNAKIHITIPSENNRIIHAPGATIKGMCTTSEEGFIQLLHKQTLHNNVHIVGEELQAEFPFKIRDMFEKSFILTRLIVETTYFNKDPVIDDFQFPLSEQVDLVKFWDKIEFRKILSHVYDYNAVLARVTMEGWYSEKRLINPQNMLNSKSLFSFRVGLNPGQNQYFVRIVNTNGSELVRDTVNYFFPSELIDESPSAKYSVSSFHTEENENGCSDCHVEILNDDCLACHASIINHKTIHPIIEEEDCSVCHDPDSSPKNQTVADMAYDTEHCTMCHDDVSEAINDVEYIHAPASEGCTMCHDPHASSYETLTTLPVKEICAYCHEDMAETPHPVPTHPISGVPDPSRPKKELTCTSCHNPHGSENSSLLYADGYGICKKCHNK